MKNWCILILAVGLLSSCDKKDDKVFDFEGIKLVDENGSPLGCHGPCGSDWEWQSISGSERDILDFPDTIDIAQLNSGVNADQMGVYPNPISRNGQMSYFIRAGAGLKVKMAIVNENLEVYNTLAFVTEEGYNEYRFHESLFSDIPSATTTRIYIGCFDKEGAVDQYGYGDFSICPEGVSGGDIQLCFE